MVGYAYQYHGGRHCRICEWKGKLENHKLCDCILYMYYAASVLEIVFRLGG
jgi:hypothetical protein